MNENIVLRHKNTDVDWDRIAPQYANLKFSPFAKEMTKVNENKESRNLLLNRLKEIPLEQSTKMRVTDFGCGPGNFEGFINEQDMQG